MSAFTGMHMTTSHLWFPDMSPACICNLAVPFVLEETILNSSVYCESRLPSLSMGDILTPFVFSSVSCIVCIDANFQLKRNRDLDRRMGHKGETGTQDPLVMSPRSIWLSDEHLAEWEAKINSMRPAKASRTSSKRKVAEMTEDDAADEEDRVEPGMTLPASALDQCLESFTAADGNCVKASTQKFDSTGVMALLCQHDWAIFLANMVTAGEKQFYAYALIAALLRELPECWKVGLLYDVACALQRSLAKWQFMPGWLDRISFGVSIFHAYGHQWVCQLWYHPRQAELWGLSDGEGCERFWSELMRLIPCLRVSGVSILKWTCMY